MTDDAESTLGTVEARVAAEFPGLELRWISAEARTGPSTPAVRRQLRTLSDRYRGARVIAMRTQPIAHAYRAFYRQTGLDPDVTRIPSEQAALDRLLHGGFLSRDLVSDALLIAVVETGVPVWALDAARVDAGTQTIRTAHAGEQAGGGDGAPVAAGRLVVADAACIHGLLFGALAREHIPGPRTRAIVLFSVGVDGVPSIYLEEALWLAGTCIQRLDPG